MPRVAYLTARSYRGTPLPPGTVPPLEEKSLELIAAAGKARGVEFDVVYWDEMDLPQRGFDLAIIRTCWDYHERPDEFVAALELHERAGLRVFNSSAIVRWNTRKTYLKELGPSAIETVWVEQADARAVAQSFDALDAAEVVVKPQVGAGSIRTVRLKRNAWSEADLIDGPLGAAMIQPYLRAIETEGERSLFWFGGRVFARDPQSAGRAAIGWPMCRARPLRRRSAAASAMEAAEAARVRGAAGFALRAHRSRARR